MLFLPLDFGLGLWKLHTMPSRRLQFLYFIGYFQLISLDSQQSLAIQSHGLSTWTAIVGTWERPLDTTSFMAFSVNEYSKLPYAIFNTRAILPHDNPTPSKINFLNEALQKNGGLSLSFFNEIDP
jgi:hypothetical protein